jgi:hypothetical protein
MYQGRCLSTARATLAHDWILSYLNEGRAAALGAGIRNDPLGSMLEADVEPLFVECGVIAQVYIGELCASRGQAQQRPAT